MKKFKVSIHPEAFRNPPTVAEMKGIDGLIAKKIVVVDNEQLGLFMQTVGKRGYVFCPSTFKDGKKSRETFKQSQLFVFSFDNRNDEQLTFKKIRDRAKYYGLPILFAYDCRECWWTDTECEQFTIVFLNETPITDLREAEAMQRALMMIFPEADKDCSVLKLSRGGNKLLYSDESMPTINAEWLMMNMCLCLKDRYGPTNYKRKLAEYARATGVKLDARNLPKISVIEDIVNNNINSVNNEDRNNIRNDKNSSNCIIDIPSDELLSYPKYKINFQNINTSDAADGIDSIDTTDSTQHNYTTYGSDLLGTLGSICGLYREFVSGSRKLTWLELLGLATNLHQIRSGQKKFNDVLSSIYEGLEKVGNWVYYFYYIRGKGSKPCSHFCPYYNVCQHGRDIISTAKPKYHQIVPLANWGEPLVDLEEAWEDFKEKFDEAVGSDEKLWHIIVSQTALGKTQAVLEFLLHTELRVLIVVPSNKLKREVYKRAKKMGIDLAISPSLHELEDELLTF